MDRMKNKILYCSGLLQNILINSNNYLDFKTNKEIDNLLLNDINNELNFELDLEIVNELE
jgi:hypothetical protein